MNAAHELTFVAACSDRAAAVELARRLGGRAYVDERDDTARLPFAALVAGVTDNLADFEAVGDVGIYVGCRRVIKPGDAAVYGLFPLVHHPAKNHTDCDAHWRDVHAPLALEHHAHMTHYVQVSVVHRIAGAAIDGFALCGFANETDLRERFFTTDASRKVIADDIQNFADTNASPRRLVATPKSF